MKGKSIIALIIFPLLAANLSAVNLGLSPWKGGFGINMATDKYDFDDNAHIEWSLTDNNPSANHYSDEAIIGIAGVYDITGSENDRKKMNITATCEGGFYFRSRSNPDAKRPFEIRLVLKGKNYGILDSGIDDSDYENEWVTLGKNSELNTETGSYPQNGVDLGRLGYQTSGVWCDLVICLPNDGITSTGVLTVGGNTYNLIEASDYSAVVEISVSFGDGAPQSLIIPLSGYYSRNNTAEDTASLNIRTLPAAMNLNIGGSRTMERVADVDFMVNQTRYYVVEQEYWWDPVDHLATEQNDFDKYHIFLSASNSPTTPAERGFELVHSSVSYTEPHTPYNSIGYTARLVSDETGEYMDFDGTDAVTAADTPGILLQLKENDSIEHSDNMTWFSEFHGGVEVMIDELSATGDMEGVTEMLHGQYTSTIYVHVVGDDS